MLSPARSQAHRLSLRMASHHRLTDRRRPQATLSAPTVPVLDPDHFAKLAHELKTPLTAIAAAAEVMRDERLGEMGNERYLSYAADIHESATHALDVITSLLSRKRKGGRGDIAPYRARSQCDRGTHGLERSGAGRIARPGACLRCRTTAGRTLSPIRLRCGKSCSTC